MRLRRTLAEQKFDEAAAEFGLHLGRLRHHDHRRRRWHVRLDGGIAIDCADAPLAINPAASIGKANATCQQYKSKPTPIGKPRGGGRIFAALSRRLRRVRVYFA